MYDLARIRRVVPVEQVNFWDAVGQEFRIACRSRYIDCFGLGTFLEQWEVTSATYVKDSTIPTDIHIDEARSTLEAVVQFLVLKEIIPFEYPIPPLSV